ncbi:type VII secretion protein EccE [Rhizocola hellebori]|uniref:Type VII secretion protein EccE n=1 Tax=Rhizocola hellebori TaxID=1392758 RepID=A0A8J3QFC8_9ACTN|nr:type VII secretion protein EccE [Rhizocola hellebori]GIH09706.1 type VII secretion protein EccE [Rhizocola hellebori]
MSVTAGRFGTAQLVAVELAALAGGGAAVAGPPVALGLGGAAAVLLGGALGRARGRWFYESAAARLRHRWRVMTPPSQLAGLAPDLTVLPITDRGNAIGIGQDRMGWFGAVAITGLDGHVTLRLDWLARLLSDFSVPVTSLQVVVRQAPFAHPPDERTHCAMSYRELLGSGPVPVNREVWLAVRLGPSDAADAAAGRGGGVAGVHKAMTAVLARIGTALTASGLVHRVLDAPTLRRTLLVTCGVPRVGGVREKWTGWHSGGLVHLGFAVRAWPANPPPGLINQLAQVPGASVVNTAVVLRPTGSPQPAVRVLLRVACAADRIAECARQAHRTANQLGTKLIRLDGEHAAAVYATAPTGAPFGVTP